MIPDVIFIDPTKLENMASGPDARAVLEAMALLDPQDCLVFCSRNISGMTWREMAAYWKASERTLKRRHVRIVAEIRGLMARK